MRKKRTISKIKTAFFAIGMSVVLSQNLYADKKNNVYSGEIAITKNIVYYDSLKIDKNATVKYPKFYLPISFFVKNLKIEHNPKPVRLYAWKFLRINSLDSSNEKIIMDTGGGNIYIGEIKGDTDYLKLIIGRYSKTVFLNTGDYCKKMDILILNHKKEQKQVVIDNKKGNFINLVCSNNGIPSLIYYRGPVDKISKKGKCKIMFVSSAKKAQKNIQTVKKDKESCFSNRVYKTTGENIKKVLKEMYDKYAWIPEKNKIYFIKYMNKNDGQGYIGSVFTINLKNNEVERHVPEPILKESGCKKINQDYCYFEREPHSFSKIMNHRKYIVKTIKIR